VENGYFSSKMQVFCRKFKKIRNIAKLPGKPAGN
jgi:hypothetical protein